MTKGEIIAALVALGFKGNVGPCGGEDPKLDANEVVLFSQLPECGYRFNDDGSVDCFFPNEDSMYNSLIYDIGYSEEEAQEEIDNPGHYDSVIDLFGSDDGWFLYFAQDNPKIVEAIKAVLAI